MNTATKEQQVTTQAQQDIKQRIPQQQMTLPLEQQVTARAQQTPNNEYHNSK